MPTTAERPLQLPFTGQALRQAVAMGDLQALLRFAADLRVAGYRVEPQRMAAELLRQGCTRVLDAFGHPVSLEVQVPEAAARLRPDETVAFRIAA